MRICIHDYAGHSFQLELSRSLARHGHDVLHLYSASNTTPQGATTRQPGDPSNFQIAGIALSTPMEKNALLKRRSQELQHGKLVLKHLAEFQPDVVMSANTPLDAQKQIVGYCNANKIKMVFWVQDLLGIGSHRLLSKKLPGLGHLIGIYYTRLERSLLRKSDAVVLIAEDFRSAIKDWRIPAQKIHVIENWAPLKEVPMLPKQNPWAIEQGLDSSFNLVYSGSLGMKHNPDLLLQLALSFQSRSDVRVVLVSEGAGAEWLKRKAVDHNLDNLTVLPFQAYEKVPQVLASADVLVAVLESSAGIFSVPSKILSYLCSGRPLLLSVPEDNLAAKKVVSAKAGLVASPYDTPAFIAAAHRLRDDEKLRHQSGCNARAYAESQFDIERITTQFEAVLNVR